MSHHTDSEVRQFAAQYFEWLEYTHKSPVTISVRRRYLNYFFNWADERGLDRVDDFERPIIESY